MTSDPRRRCVLLASLPAADRAPYLEAAAAIGIDLTGDPFGAAIEGVLAADGPGARMAAAAAERLELPWHPRRAVDASLDPLLARGRLMAAGLPVPWFFTMPADGTLASVADRLRFPCVVRPLGGRGAVRAADPASFEAACAQVLATLAAGASASPGGIDHGLLVEAFVPGEAVVLEGVLTHGALHVLAMLEARGALQPHDEARVVASMVAHAAAALGLRHGPVHAACRVTTQGVVTLGVWPWPGDGPETRALRFGTRDEACADREDLTLFEILLRHSLGESLEGFGRVAG
jgi:biotin carboxylase